MCTSIIFSPKDHYFGRNFDYEISFGQQVTITPRNYNLKFRKMGEIKTHYAMVGIADVAKDYPLYFDAVNEEGLGMAGLAYADNAYYPEEEAGKDNVSPFEFIPWILSQAKNISEAKKLLANINLVNINFAENMPLSPLHWLLADKSGQSIVVEPDKDGVHVYDNPAGVLTNDPAFPKQFFTLNNYQEVSPSVHKNTLAPGLKLDNYSRALASHTLPGGMDSSSRFVRATFAKFHAPTEAKTEEEAVRNYFHILHAVEQPKGLDEVAPSTYEYTIYTDCTNLEKGLFYYTTYNNKQIHQIDMNKENLDSSDLINFEMKDETIFDKQN